MTNYNILKTIIYSAVLVFFTACDDFEEINEDPYAASEEQVAPEYLLNSSMVGAQMNPDVAERSFILYWKVAGHQQWNGGFESGSDNDQWTNVYWDQVSGWLNYANIAIDVAEEIKDDPVTAEYNDNMIQIARIWRAYLMSEAVDNWGPIPIEAFDGENPDFNSEKDVYYYMLDELKDAVHEIDPELAGMDDQNRNQDVAYQMDWEKWIKYGNSMRMRLAMRMSEVDEGRARTEFEDLESAISNGEFIASNDDNFEVEEDGDAGTFNDYSGVMTRSWNEQILSAALNSAMIGFGGIKSEDQDISSDAKANIKADDYLGLKFEEQYPTITNYPYTGYFFDGLPNKIDPRAYQNFYIPNDKDSGILPAMYEMDEDDMIQKMKYSDDSEVEINTQYTWNANPGGDWGRANGRNEMHGIPQYSPAIGQQFRSGDNDRLFFGSWESYFLIAEAGLRGWSVPMSDEEAYNQGVEENLEYFGVGQYYNDYIESTEYNRNGTSVKYTHTDEPPASRSMDYKDGKSGSSGTASINYPENHIYENGTVNNDKLTKIITQKFIANTPWLPLETWSDHRRLGLLFFENPARENSLSNLPNLSKDNYMEVSVENFPQRLRYPGNFKGVHPEGYDQAVDFLGGDDKVTTPLWWAQKP